MEILEKATPGHPDLADTLNNYATLLQKMNRETKASQMQKRAAQIRETYNRENAAN
ncbi:MAG TPA: hypothetical protein VF762_20465 [Blastocatellia bacterium]